MTWSQLDNWIYNEILVQEPSIVYEVRTGYRFLTAARATKYILKGRDDEGSFDSYHLTV